MSRVNGTTLTSANGHKSSFIDINGNNVHYLIEGNRSAPALVLVHGFTASMREGNRASAARIARKMARLANSGYVNLGISEISVPTLVMWGEKDTITPFELIKYWQRDLPHAAYITYPELGHVPMEEDPTRTARDLRNYLHGYSG